MLLDRVMTQSAIEFVPEEFFHVRIILKPRVVAVEQWRYGRRDLTLAVQNGNQNVLFVICIGMENGTQ